MKENQMLPSAPRMSQAGLRLSACFRGAAKIWRTSDRRRSFFCTVLEACLLLLLCLALLVALIGTVSLSVVEVTSGQIVSLSEVEQDLGEGKYDCILVLGAGVRADGSPSDMLYDRVSVACELYTAATEAGIPLLMSGDHTGNYNEVGVMKTLAAELGVPTEDIFLDHKGYSTYESMYRAKHVFGAKRVVIVTQEYHLHRALYIARELGIEAVGVSADLRPYLGQSRYELREVLARFKDLFTAAKGDYEGHLEPPVDLSGDGNAT